VCIALTLGSACAVTGSAVAGGEDALATAPGAPAWRYTLRPDAALTTLDVVACFAGDAPSALVPGGRGAGRLVTARGWDDRGPFPLTPDAAGVLRLPFARRDACVAYRLDLGATLAAGDGDGSFRVGRDAVLATDAWLWRPREVPDDARAWVAFDLPAGLAATTPWPAVPDRPATYAVDASGFAWRGQLLLGHFAPRALVIDDRTTFEVVLLDGATATTAVGREHWLRAAAAAVSDVVGAFPRGHLQVVIAPTPGAGGDPVAFGYVLRGGGASITLLLSAGASDAALRHDWVAVHELFHLTMPPIDGDDAWFSEGVTMYFTELLRVRAGFLSPDAGFAALHDGFTRGRNDGTGRTLAAESRDMHATRAYRRVYWAGAAIALRADLALRRDTGTGGLAPLMAQLFRCCSRSDHFWTAAAVIERLDGFAGAPVFAAATKPWLSAAAFPPLADAYGSLGLDPTTGAPDAEPAHAALREAIMRPDPDAARDAATP